MGHLLDENLTRLATHAIDEMILIRDSTKNKGVIDINGRVLRLMSRFRRLVFSGVTYIATDRHE